MSMRYTSFDTNLGSDFSSTVVYMRAIVYMGLSTAIYFDTKPKVRGYNLGTILFCHSLHFSEFRCICMYMYCSAYFDSLTIKA